MVSGRGCRVLSLSSVASDNVAEYFNAAALIRLSVPEATK